MPELPEVHTISSDLNKEITGWKIIKTSVSANYKTLPNNANFSKIIVGSTVLGVRRVAKNIIIDLDNEHSLVIHLAMTGRLLLNETKRQDSWVRVAFLLEKDGARKILKFADMRMFGKVELIKTGETKMLIQKYGPEPLDSDLEYETFFKSLTSIRTTIKNALLDQSVVAGLGNIYATDTLYLSGVHPETSTKDIDLAVASRILDNARLILMEGIAHRGSTLEDEMYVDIYGRPGTHQKHFRIYSKKVCPKCNQNVEYKKINGRGTYFCPHCQTKPIKGGLFQV